MNDFQPGHTVQLAKSRASVAISVRVRQIRGARGHMDCKQQTVPSVLNNLLPQKNVFICCGNRNEPVSEGEIEIVDQNCRHLLLLFLSSYSPARSYLLRGWFFEKYRFVFNFYNFCILLLYNTPIKSFTQIQKGSLSQALSYMGVLLQPLLRIATITTYHSCYLSRFHTLCHDAV